MMYRARQSEAPASLKPGRGLDRTRSYLRNSLLAALLALANVLAWSARCWLVNP